MSIHDELNYRCQEGRLYKLTLGVPGLQEPREIWVAPEINRLLVGPWWNTRQAMRWGRVKSDLASFLQGDLITVPQEHRRPRSHYMARLLWPSSPEVWEIRCRDPRPSIRIFGRFADTDAFVAFHWRRRGWLGAFGHRAWRAASVQCTTDWRNLLPSYRPHSSEDYPDGYISGSVIV
jgi:hypothetical protein